MKNSLRLGVLGFFIFLPLVVPATIFNMNLDWRFAKPSVSFPLADAAKSMEQSGKPFYAPDYNDSAWELVSVPHAINAADSFDGHGIDAGEASLYRGFMFYRKHVTLAAADSKKVFLAFESVRQTIYLYVNGIFAGYYEGGTSPSAYDISKLVHAGDNVIAVATDNTSGRGLKDYMAETMPGHTPGDNSGSHHQWNGSDFNEIQGGLTGNVLLYIKDSVYLTLPYYNNLETLGAYVTATNFDFAVGSATIRVQAQVRNESAAPAVVKIEVAVLDAGTGKPIGSFISSQSRIANQQSQVVLTTVPADAYSKTPAPTVARSDSQLLASARLAGLTFWSPATPHLYDVVLTLKDSAGKVLDTETVRTGFRHAAYDAAKGGFLLNEKPAFFPGYAQRSTDEWPAIGVAPDWLHDFDASLIRESGASFIRWMHVSPKPAPVRAMDKYGIVCVCPAGDKESDAKGRAWAQRLEAMRAALIYFRNSPSVFFWEAGNNAVTPAHMKEMRLLKQALDPDGYRFMGCRTISSPAQVAEAEYVGTMIHRHDLNAFASMREQNRYLPMMETEFCREESSRRTIDRFTPPDYDFICKWLRGGAKKAGYDCYEMTQEDFIRSNADSQDGYAYFYGNRASGRCGKFYTCWAMLCWTDSNQHCRQSGSENCRSSGRVDAVRIPKEDFYALQVFQSATPRAKILGHWNYPPLGPDTYNYHDREWNGTCMAYTDKVLKRDPLHKTVYVVGSVHCASMELMVNGKSVGVNKDPKDLFVYEFPNINVTRPGAVEAIARDEKGNVIARDRIETVGSAAKLALAVTTGPEGLRADGSDVAFIDVMLLDAQGRVLPYATGRIDFTLTGPGTFLGGYNSGTFDDTSVIHKPFCNLECGRCRVFIRAGRTPGKLTLAAKGVGFAASATLASIPVQVEGGLMVASQQSQMPNSAATLKFATLGLTANDPAAVRDLAASPAGAATYLVFVNGKKVSFKKRVALPYKPDASTGVVGAFAPVLDAIKAAGGQCDYTYQAKGKLPAYLKDFQAPLLTLSTDGKKIDAACGETALWVDEGKDKNLTNCEMSANRGVLYGEYAPFLGYIPGVTVVTDEKNRKLLITVKGN